jgi:hypothetical protein
LLKKKKKKSIKVKFQGKEKYVKKGMHNLLMRKYHQYIHTIVNPNVTIN